MKSIKSMLFAAIAMAVVPAMAQKSIPLVYDQEFTGAKYPAPAFPTVDEAKVVETLPNPFEFSNGKKQVKKFKDWEKRRAEIIRELYHYEVGEKPMVDKKDIKATLENNTLTVVVYRNGDSLTITSRITYPEGDGPFPLMIGMSGISLPRNFCPDRNIATMNFNMSQVMAHQQKRGSEPINKIYPELVENGAYAMWPWGVSRIIDGLEIVGAASKIDMKHIGVTGCSYAGKMALWSGAFDERIALVIAHEPGGGGIASWRYSETLGNVERSFNTNDSWFFANIKTDYANEKIARMPVDHHELAAMVCPRALLYFGNTDYEWLADESGYVSINAAKEVWKTFGIADRVGYSISGGHGHCQLPEAEYPYLEAFIDRFLLDKHDVKTEIANAPKFKDVDWKSWIADWK